MNNSICTLFDNILIDIHKFKSLLENKCVVGFRYELFVSDEGNMETSLEERMLFQGRLLAML